MEEIHTEGGAVINGNVHANGDFVGRDSVSIDNSVTIGQLNVNVRPTNSKNSIRVKKQNKPKSINATIQILRGPLSLFIKCSIPFVILLLLAQLIGLIFVVSTGIWHEIVLIIVMLPLICTFLFYHFSFVHFHFRLQRASFYDDFTVSQRDKIKQNLQRISFGNIILDSYAHWVTRVIIETNKTKASRRRKLFF